nr:plasmid mobilization relaxosome protein MobC [Acinetobacter tandoii]
MEKGKRNIVKKLRFLEIQAQQLNQLLESENMIFTDFIHLMIGREFMKMQHTVLHEIEVIQDVEIKKRHRRKNPVAQRPTPKIDPDFLRELGRIGNNINQIARALNYLCLAQQHEQLNFSFLECVEILDSMQAELHQHLALMPNQSQIGGGETDQVDVMDAVMAGR